MRPSSPILIYHSVAEEPVRATRRLAVTPAALREQLAWLTDHGFTAMTFFDAAEALSRSGLPDRTVVLTFDDGYADFATRRCRCCSASVIRRHCSSRPVGWPMRARTQRGGHWIRRSDGSRSETSQSAGSRSAPMDTVTQRSTS